MLASLLTLASILLAAGDASAKKPDDTRPHVVFVTGDCEYRSEITMPMIAKILEDNHGMRCSVVYAINDKTGAKEPKFRNNLVGLEALKTADLAVFFLRFRSLPDDQLQLILDYVNSGKPYVGLRTSTHALRYENGPHTKLNDSFPIAAFGQKWIRHHGHDSTTNVYKALADHPIVRGVDQEIHCRSWLYHVIPLHGNCVPLMLGQAIKGEKADGQIFGIPSPVAWTLTKDDGARVFFTTLGHPADFESESVRKLLVNGIFWALDKEVPSNGCDVPLKDYVPPPTT